MDTKNMTAEEPNLGDIPELLSLASVNFETWKPEECPQCKDGIPINRKVGAGKNLKN